MPRLFDSYQLKGLQLRNRVMMSPMCQYQAEESGYANDWHFVHYGARAIGGVGLVMIEATAVESRGRITKGDLGLWTDEHMTHLERIVKVCQAHGAKVGIQLAHAGAKSQTGIDNVSASAYTRFEEYGTPRELTADEIRECVENWRLAAKRALEIGVDTVEIHGAHGYLLNEFLSPITNRRLDEYGGSLENRMRFPLEVVAAVKAELPADMPLFLRVSAVEYDADGYDLQEMIEMARLFKEAGVDVIDCSSGGNVPVRPDVYPGYQLPYADAIRREAGVQTVAVGRLHEAALAEEAVRSERADLIAVGTALLRNPHHVKEMALQLGTDVELYRIYEMAFPKK